MRALTALFAPSKENIMEQSALIAHCGTRKLGREELTAILAPEGSLTHRPIPHHEIVTALIETLGFRHIASSRTNTRSQRTA